MSPELEILDSFLSDPDNFIVKLRNWHGLDRENIQVFMEVLEQVGERIKNKSVVDKQLAYSLVVIVPTLMSNALSYPADKQEDILTAIDYITMKIYEILED